MVKKLQSMKQIFLKIFHLLEAFSTVEGIMAVLVSLLYGVTFVSGLGQCCFLLVFGGHELIYAFNCQFSFISIFVSLLVILSLSFTISSIQGYSWICPFRIQILILLTLGSVIFRGPNFEHFI